MNADLLNAILHLRTLSELPIEKQKAYVREYPELGWDGIVLMRQYLADHPADDDETITEKWLRAVGAKQEEQPIKWRFLREDAMTIGLWHVDDGWKAMLLHTEYHASCIVRGLKTRGDIRKLAAALKITLALAEKVS